MANVEEEIKELRRFRHDLEGLGIMKVPAKVEELEKAVHRDEIDNIRTAATLDALKEGFTRLSKAIEGFHSDIRDVREEVTNAVGKIKTWAVIGIVTLSISTLLPDEVMTSLVTSLAVMFR